MILRICTECHEEIKPTPITTRDRKWCRCPNNAVYAVKEPTPNFVCVINPASQSGKKVNRLRRMRSGGTK